MEHDVEKQHTWDVGTRRAELIEQVARDMQTLRQLRELGYCAHPGESFYTDRITAYQYEIRKLDRTGVVTPKGDDSQ